MKEEVGGITLGDLKKWPLSTRVMIGLSVLVLFVVYVFYPVYPTVTGKSLAGWTLLACNGSKGFLHGRLVPLIFPWMIWWAWKCRQEEVMKPSYWGLIWLGVGLWLFWASARVVQARWAMAGAPLVVIGVGQYLFGWRIAKAVVFPAFFLWFAIPIPGLVGWVDQQAVMWLVPSTHQAGLFLGMDVVREGGVLIVGERELWIGSL